MEYDYEADGYRNPPDAGDCNAPNVCHTNGNITAVREFHFGLNSPGAQARRTTRSYLTSADDPAYGLDQNHILNRKKSELVYDGTATAASGRTEWEYDQYTTDADEHGPVDIRSGMVQFDAAYKGDATPFIKARGNVTTVKRYATADPPSSPLKTIHRYDEAGNVTWTKDPRGNATTFTFAADTQFAYPKTITPPITTLAINKTYQYTYTSEGMGTGLLATETDPNGQVTQYSYDNMDRVLTVDNPDGGQTTYTYNEAAFPLNVVTLKKITSALSLTTKTTFDGLGRVMTSQLTSDPGVGGIVTTDITYDSLDRKSSVSNPYRSTSASTDGITQYQYDILGRVTKVIPPDGSTSSNNITTIYSGNTSKATDQAGKVRQYTTDALGRIQSVLEPDSAGALVNQTVYQYDALDNLIRVDQKGNGEPAANWRTRTFNYNSLSQLTSATNPESGTTTSTYYDDGLLATRTAPKPNQTDPAVMVKTTYTYDNAHRLTGKSYDNGEASVAYFHDQTSYNGLTILNGKGRRTGMSDASGATAWSFDGVGRVLTERRTLSGTTGTTNYTYNLDGSLNSITYPINPFTRTITYTYSGAGRPLSAQNRPGLAPPFLVKDAAYTPHGALTSATYGYNPSSPTVFLTGTYTYNNRLQPVDMGVVNNAGTIFMSLSYNFNLGTANNGNVAKITNNRDNSRTQIFTYDELNRVKTANSQATSGPNCWGQQFGYDIWSNLTSISSTQCSTPGSTLSVDKNNHLMGGTYSYDAAGNLLNDGTRAYAYDTEGRISAAAGFYYTYDGDGRRVKKSNGSDGRLYWYDQAGNPVVETDLTGAMKLEHFYFGGKRIAYGDWATLKVSYVVSDHIGSARTKVNGDTLTLEQESDFYPFGGERPIVSGPTDQFYKFTGKERDQETGLDYFLTRYYGSTLGRFMSPDNFQNDTHPGNPQSWNLYAYARNNPLRFNDPTGESIVAFDLAGNVICRDAECQFDKEGNLTVGGKTYNMAQYTYDDPNPAAQVTVQIPKNYPLIEPGLGDMTPELVDAMMLGTGITRSIIEVGAKQTLKNMALDEVKQVTGATVRNFAKEKRKHKSTDALRAHNKEVTDLVKQYGLTKDEQRRLHDIITKEGYTREEIEQIIIHEILGR